MTAIGLGIVSPEYQAEFEQILSENGGDLQAALMTLNARHGKKSGQSLGTVSEPNGTAVEQPAVSGAASNPGVIDNIISGGRKLLGRKAPMLREGEMQRNEQRTAKVQAAGDFFAKLKDPAFTTLSLLALMLLIAALSELSIKSALHEAIAK